MGTLHEDRYTFLITHRSILLKIRNVLGKKYRENQNTRFFDFFFENLSVHKIM